MALFTTASPLLTPSMRRLLTVTNKRLSQQVFGLTFDNPVGLAAGFDKQGRWIRQMMALGFSHTEIGTVTGQGQPGNPKPRLFRLPKDQAVINRMGFNNSGADSAARRLSQNLNRSQNGVLGINIGKTKTVPLENSISDYQFSFDRLFSYADYFTINVSSPNTPGLRELQNRDQLVELLSSLVDLNQQLATDHEVAAKPILLKIAPDLSDSQLEDIALIAQEVDIQGIIATNTTISREGLTTDTKRVVSMGDGGLSGRPLTLRSRQVVAKLYQMLPPRIPIIGVGGIMNGEDAWQMILSGARLVQIYTGLVYQGPTIVRDINRYLLKQLDKHQLTSIDQAVGAK